MAEAETYQDGEMLDFTPVAAVTAGDVLQVPDGRAAWAPSAIAAGVKGAVQVSGVAKVAKTANIVILAGGKVMFDRSAGTATVHNPLSDSDFYLGRAIEDAAASATTVKVALNEKGNPLISLQESAFAHARVLTAGVPIGAMQGGSYLAAFSATAEAQKLDLLSQQSFPLAANWIFEAVVCVQVTADADVADLSIGVANGTHASDADSITEAALFHFDLGADLNIDVESDDGTVEVNATDSTIDFAAGTPVHLALDGRDPTNVKYYINGAEVNAATANLGDIRLAAGPMKALFHLEKSSNDTLCEVRLDCMEVRVTPEL